MSTVLTLYRSACSWGLHIGDGLNHLKYQLLFICDHRSHSLLPSGILLFSFLGIHVRLIGNPVQFSAIGPAYAAGLQLGVWDESIFGKLNRVSYKQYIQVPLLQTQPCG